MLATEYAKWYEIEGQRPDESDMAFRTRVANALHAQGNLIEAHEARVDKRYDEEGADSVLDGLFGAAAIALRGKPYSTNPDNQIGDEIAAGVIARNPQDEPDSLMLMMAILLGR